MTFDEIDWANFQPRMRATLLFVVRDGKVLLIHKKRGLGAGKINGPGGRIERGESARAAAVREVAEELLATPTNVRQCGELYFQFTDSLTIYCVVFRADDLDGEPRETDEAVPEWFALDKIPFDRMWADDRVWFPYMLSETPFVGRFLFDDDTMLDHEIVEGMGQGMVTRNNPPAPE